MIATRRVFKQTLYAAIGLGIVTFFIAIVILPYFNLFYHNPIAPPPVPESIVIESVDTIVHNNTVDLVARVRNPNPRAGIPDYTITFKLLDANGDEINVISEATYLLPGSLKYVTSLDVPVTAQLDKVRVEQTDSPIFTALDIDTTIPSFSSFLRDRTTKDLGGETFEIQTGIITNAGNLGYRRVDVTGISFDSENRVVGAAKTFVGEFHAGEQREFTLQWPKPFYDTAKVIIIPDANIYSEDNILPVTGDSGRLRDQITIPEK